MLILHSYSFSLLLFQVSPLNCVLATRRVSWRNHLQPLNETWAEAAGAKERVCSVKYCAGGGTHLPGTVRKRWSGGSEPRTAAVPLSAPGRRNNLPQFPRKRSSWRKSGSTWWEGWGERGNGFIFLVFTIKFQCVSSSAAYCMQHFDVSFDPAVHWPTLYVCVCVYLCC